MMSLTGSSKKRIKQIIIFILTAALLQGLFITFALPSSVTMLYPLAVTVNAQKVALNNNSYIEYYKIRERLSAARVFIVGADTSVAETYELLADLLQYIKLNVNVTRLLMEVGITEAAQINDCITAQNDETYAENLTALREVIDKDEEFFAFIGYLKDINNRMPPQKKITVTGVSGASGEKSAIAYIDSVLSGRYSRFPGDYKLAVMNGDLEAFVAAFDETGANFGSELGDEDYAKLKAVCNEYNNSVKYGAFTNDMTAARIELALGAGDDDTCYLALVDSSRTGYGSSFMNSIARLTGDTLPLVTIDFKYDNCSYTAENGETIARDDITLPLLSDTAVTYRLVDTAKMQAFFKYSDAVNLGIGRIDDPRNFASEIYFIISDGNAAANQTGDSE